MYHRNPKYSWPIELQEVELILEDCGKNTPFEIVVPELGSGDYGYAFLTTAGNVVKITTHKVEAELAQFILKHPEPHPALPHIFDLYTWEDCHRYDDPIYVIHRESLKDLPVISKDWVNNVIMELEHRISMTEDDPVDLAVVILEEEPGHPNDELLFEQIVDLYDWGSANGLVFNDTGVQNWGIRDDGTVVVRDLGAFKVLGDSDINAKKIHNGFR